MTRRDLTHTQQRRAQAFAIRQSMAPCHLATLAGLIGQGLGISLVPELTLFQFRSMDLTAISLETAAVVRPILIVQQRKRPMSHAAQGRLALIERRLRTKTRARAPFRRRD